MSQLPRVWCPFDIAPTQSSCSSWALGKANQGCEGLVTEVFWEYCPLGAEFVAQAQASNTFTYPYLSHVIPDLTQSWTLMVKPIPSWTSDLYSGIQSAQLRPSKRAPIQA